MTKTHKTDTAQRAKKFLTAAAQVAPDWYDKNGDWIASSTSSGTRDRFWLSLALYANNAVSLADAIVRKGRTVQKPREFSIFNPNAAAVILLLHRNKMAVDVREKLTNLVRKSFGFYPGNRQPDFQFHGFNDNMPAKATLGLIIGGELLDEPDAVQYGLWNLRQLRAMLVRRGINSEFNSPTYSPLTLHAMGEIAEYAQNEEARHLARSIEARLWLDVAARFHPKMGVLAGPYSRAYTVDTIAHLSLMATMLWINLGDAARPSPMLLFDVPDDLVLHHMHDVPFNISQVCWLAAGSYHIPDRAMDFFSHKDFPFSARASYELGEASPDFPARSGHIETWIQPDFTVGTAQTPMGGGEQTMSYFATYCRTKNVQSYRDVGTIYHKTVLNDQVPGTIKKTNEADSNEGEEDHLTSHSNTLAMQHQATAIVLTHPHLSLGGAGATLPPQTQQLTPLSRLSEMIIFNAHFGGADEIMVGNQKRDAWKGTANHGEWIVARRGRLLVGIRPMTYSVAFGLCPVTLETINQYQIIRSTFYQGPQRTFTRNELGQFFGGFIAEHASVDEFESLEEFAKVLSATQFTDYYWNTRRIRYRRLQSTSFSALDVEVSWSTGTSAPRYATINGELPERTSVQIDGVKNDDIPFLDDKFQPTPGFFPWQDFKNVWYDLPYAIADREEE